MSSPTPKMFASPSAAAPARRLLQRLQNKGVALRRLHNRERRRLRRDVGRVPGLMALLMKARNGQPWISVERSALRAQLRSMRRLGLYVAVMFGPGTAITLPLLAWWLDRRHIRRLPLANESGETNTK